MKEREDAQGRLTSQGLPHNGAEALGALHTEFGALSFEEIRDRAPAVFRRWIPEAKLVIADQHSRGLTAHTEALPPPPEWHRLYFGPPEPLWLIVHGLPEGRQAEWTAALFCDALLVALTAAGYEYELGFQARRDWLTGLPTLEAFERELHEDPSYSRVVGLIELRPGMNVDDPVKLRGRLDLRAFARSLRSILADDEHAFRINERRIALLLPEAGLARLDAFLGREPLGRRRAWVALGEAHGIEAVRLVQERLKARTEASAAPTIAPERSEKAERERVPLTLYSGPTVVSPILESVLREWRFDVPITLIFDEPIGHALTALGRVEGGQVVLTRAQSVGYLLDLRAMQPHGILVEPANLGALKAQLQRIVDGERVYSGPILDDIFLPRERKVWRLAAAGATNAEIACSLQIQAKTVANYIGGLRTKLSLPTRAALVLAYWSLLPTDQDKA